MPRVRLKFNPAASGDWLAVLSTDFPEAEFRLLANHPTDDGLLGVLEIHGSDTDAIVRRFVDSPEVSSYDMLHTEERAVLIRAMTPVPTGYRANRASGTPPNFPARMQDGWLHTELTASHERLSQFIDELAAADIPYQIQSLSQSHDSNELLTDRQQEFLFAAVEQGYYDSPRDCTLTELAEAFNISKSAASGVLHRAESRIIKSYCSSSSEIDGPWTDFDV